MPYPLLQANYRILFPKHGMNRLAEQGIKKVFFPAYMWVGGGWSSSDISQAGFWLEAKEKWKSAPLCLSVSSVYSTYCHKQHQLSALRPLLGWMKFPSKQETRADQTKTAKWGVSPSHRSAAVQKRLEQGREHRPGAIRGVRHSCFTLPSAFLQ